MPMTKLELRTAYGPVWRGVSADPPRDARADEIPVIDIGRIDGTLTERKQLAQIVRIASENTGFFYIKNHAIPEKVITHARDAAMCFFKQSQENKMKVSKSRSKHFNGYLARGTNAVSPSEGRKW